MLLENVTTLEISLDNQLNHFVYISSGVVLAIVGITGSTLNLLIITLILHDKKNRWTPFNVALLNLSIADLLMTAIGNPFATISALNGGWFWSHGICIWYGWIMATVGLASIGHLTAMAVDRWFLITKPMVAFSGREAGYLALLVWIYALCLSTPPIFGFGKYGSEAHNISCSIQWESQDSETNMVTYVAYLMIGGFVIPVMIISYCYGSILVTLKRVEKRVTRRRTREERISKMVILMIIGFLIGWTPYTAVAILKQFFQITVCPLVAMVPAIMAKSSGAYNPIIYGCLNPQLLLKVKRLFFKRQGTIADRDGQKN